MTPAARSALAGGTAVACGFGLSFLGFGLLWIAMAWPVQAAMLLPFAACSYGLGRWSGQPRKAATMLFAGMAPLGFLLLLFRDKDGSHLAPALIVLAWVAGIVIGAMVARMRALRD